MKKRDSFNKLSCISLLLIGIMLQSNIRANQLFAIAQSVDTIGVGCVQVTGYAPVNGLKMYYEIHGKGSPIILLHGAYMSIEGPIRQLSDSLSKKRKVIITELQGHGRTGDIDRPLSYEQMADDVAGLLRYLKVDSADVFGYSMGGSVAIQLAIRHSYIVHKMIIASSAVSDDGIHVELKKMIPLITPEMFQGSPPKIQYDTLSPNPDNWSKLINKFKKLEMTPYNWIEPYSNLHKPQLLIFGDSDAVTLSHAIEMFNKLGGGVMGDLKGLHESQLAIIPGTTHQGIMGKLNFLVPMINQFLK